MPTQGKTCGFSIGEGSRTSAARERIFSAPFALFSLQGDSLAASKRTKITRKSLALGCFAVFTEPIWAETRRSPQGILPYFQGLQRSIGANQPVNTGRCSTPFAYSRRNLYEPGFDGQLSACTSLKYSTIHRGCSAFLPRADANLLRQNSFGLQTDDISGDFQLDDRRRARARQDRRGEKRRKSAV